jgi:hypothetical protein
VGIRLIVEVLDHCPTTLTHREKLALVVLAESARDRTRECLPGIENDENIARRMKLPARSSRYEVIQALRSKGALEVVSSGRKYSRAVYRIPDLTTAQRPENPDADTAPQGPENPDAERSGSGFSGSGNSGLRVRKTRTQGPENPDPFPSTPSIPSLIDISAARANPATPTADATPAVGFADFYAAYPKKRARADAERAWAKVIKAGADPQKVIDAAHAYAKERQGQDPRYTKHPATWLNQACYDDEPDQQTFPLLRAVSGDWTGPYQAPSESDYQNQQGF